MSTAFATQLQKYGRDNNNAEGHFIGIFISGLDVFTPSPYCVAPVVCCGSSLPDPLRGPAATDRRDLHRSQRQFERTHARNRQGGEHCHASPAYTPATAATIRWRNWVIPDSPRQGLGLLASRAVCVLTSRHLFPQQRSDMGILSEFCCCGNNSLMENCGSAEQDSWP